MKIAIGIISYFPDAADLRAERVRRCAFLISSCKALFPQLPIVIIAQNWRGEIEEAGLLVQHHAAPLGISAAREALRQYILEGGYDYVILFDDDCMLDAEPADAQRFLELLSANPAKFIGAREGMLKLFAVSREILSSEPVPPLCVSDSTGLEDYALWKILRHSYPDAEIKGYDWGTLCEISSWWGDKYSTWPREHIPELVQKTHAYLEGRGIKL